MKIFKKAKEHTAIHPEYKTLIEFVAVIEGRKLYQFKNLLDMPHDRYNKCTRFSTEFNMRIDSMTLKESLKDCLEYANTGNFTKVIQIITILQEMNNTLLSIDASYRLASCVYFWENESLNDYDFAIGDEKIKMFKEYGFENFFLSKPMSNFLPPMDISLQDLNQYLLQESKYKNLLSSLLKKTNAKSTKQT